MSGYGFRLYRVQLVGTHGGSKRIPFDKAGAAGDTHVGHWVDRCLDLLEGHDRLVAMPQLRAPVDDPLPPMDDYHSIDHKKGEPAIRWMEHSLSGPRQIFFQYAYGTVGRVSFAMGRVAEEDLPLDELPAAEHYRAILHFPVEGESGILAVETVPGGQSSADVVNAWLTRAAIELKAQDEKVRMALPDEDARKLEPRAFKLIFNQVANYPRLERMIKESSAAALVLRKTTIGKSGKPTNEEVRLESKVQTKTDRLKAVEIARGVYAKATGGVGIDDTAALAELQDLAPGDVSGLGFNDGYLQIDDGSGKKKIGPHHLDRFFEYRISSEIRPGDTKWQQEVWKEVVALQGLLESEFDLS